MFCVELEQSLHLGIVVRMEQDLSQEFIRISLDAEIASTYLVYGRFDLRYLEQFL